MTDDDERIRELHDDGLSIQQISTRLERSKSTVHRVLAALAGGDPGDVVALLADEWPHADELSLADISRDPECWRRLSPLERWRFAHIPGGRRVPLHDPDRRQCCTAYEVPPDGWIVPNERDTVSHPWPPPEPDDDW